VAVRRKKAAKKKAAPKKKAAKRKKPAKKKFYQSVQLVTQGVMDYARRLAIWAQELALQAETQKDFERQKLLQSIAESCRRVPAEPATTLRDAIQATWILFLCQHQESRNAGLSLGRLDLWWEPYLQKEMEGITDPQHKKKKIELLSLGTRSASFWSGRRGTVSGTANLEVARRMERIVRQNGAVPATIAVLGGQLRVGLAASELEHLATGEGIRKTSRRDLPVLVAGVTGQHAQSFRIRAAKSAWGPDG